MRRLVEFCTRNAYAIIVVLIGLAAIVAFVMVSP